MLVVGEFLVVVAGCNMKISVIKSFFVDYIKNSINIPAVDKRLVLFHKIKLLLNW